MSDSTSGVPDSGRVIGADDGDVGVMKFGQERWLVEQKIQRWMNP